MKLLSHYLQNKNAPRHEIVNWENVQINDSLFYSARSTRYDRNTFPSSLHSHDYYELVIFSEGEINYVCESSVYSPRRGDVIIIPPGKFHMSRIKGVTHHVNAPLCQVNVFIMVTSTLAITIILSGSCCDKIRYERYGRYGNVVSIWLELCCNCWNCWKRFAFNSFNSFNRSEQTSF